jgi:hypothetical protein
MRPNPSQGQDAKTQSPNFEGQKNPNLSRYLVLGEKRTFLASLRLRVGFAFLPEDSSVLEVF